MPPVTARKRSTPDKLDAFIKAVPLLFPGAAAEVDGEPMNDDGCWWAWVSSKDGKRVIVQWLEKHYGFGMSLVLPDADPLEGAFQNSPDFIFGHSPLTAIFALSTLLGNQETHK